MTTLNDNELMQHPAVSAWLSQLAAQNRAAHTMTAYRRDLSALASFLVEQHISWADLDRALLHAYVSTRLERDALSASSVQREMSSLRQFYQWLTQQTHITVNPFLGFKIKRATRPLPEMLDVDAVTQLLDQPSPETPAQAELWLRDKAMFELLYGSGLRVAELVGIDVADIDLNAASLRVVGKGNKMRQLPVGSKAMLALQDWLTVRQRWKGSQGVQQAIVDTHDNAVFISQRAGKRVSTRTVQLRIKHHAQRAGIDQALYPHLLRHCFASHLLSNSGDLRGVQELLGHRNISTTQIYTHLDFEKLTAVYDDSHPRAKQR